jgi:hypothetical protein
MQAHRVAIVTVGLLLVGVTPMTPALEIDPTLRKELDGVFSTQCRVYLSKLAAYYCVTDSVIIDPTTKEVLEKRKFESKQNGKCNLFSQTYSFTPKRKPLDQVRVMNSDYSFRLERGRDDWFLKHVKQHESIRDAIDPFFMFPDGDMVLRGMSPYAVHLHWLPELLTESGCEMTLLKSEQRGTDKLIRLGFNYLPQKDKLPSQSPHEGWLLLSPDHYWVVKEFELTEKKSLLVKTIRRTNEFSDDNDIPLLRSSTLEYKGRHRDGTQLPPNPGEVLTYQFIKQPIPESAFRLSAFGFPEPVGLPQERGVPNYVWFLAAAAACAMLAAGFRHMSRRKHSLPVS